MVDTLGRRAQWFATSRIASFTLGGYKRHELGDALEEFAQQEISALLAAAQRAVEVSKAGRALCPFSAETEYRGRPLGRTDSCPVCKKAANGDGGSCATEIANNGAIIELENFLSARDTRADAPKASPNPRDDGEK